jgi:hypothetical protein
MKKKEAMVEGEKDDIASDRWVPQCNMKPPSIPVGRENKRY